MRKLQDWQVKDLLTETDERGVLKWPVRALRWAWFTMPSKFGYGEKSRFAVANDRFHWLKMHQKSYLAFLEENKLTLESYDRAFSKTEPEERATW